MGRSHRVSFESKIIQVSFYNFVSEKLILPASDILLKRSISENFNFLLKSQWWSEEELAGYQEDRLRRLIRHAYENVPYYHDLFTRMHLTPGDIRSIADLKKLPLLTKEDFRKHGPEMFIARNIPRKDTYLTGSSGSTGEPLHYLITRDAYSFNIAANLRGWYWMGYRLGDKFVKLSQNPRGKKEKKIQDLVNRNKYLFAQQLTGPNFESIVGSLRSYRPSIIRGYPDPLFFLARYLRDHGIDDIKLKAVTSTGNILFPEARALIEQQFHCKIFDSYSCEGAPNYFECSTHECYHSSMEYGISEVYKSGNEMASPGERGRLVITDLMNYAVPFIHYDTQDIVVRSSAKCSCGRNLSGVSKIEGRDNDLLITPRGKYLIVHNFTGFFQSPEMQSISQFQVYQDRLDHMIIRLLVNDQYNADIERYIKQYWHDYIADGVNIEIRVEDEIIPSPSGKRRFLIRDKNIPLDL
jgi:phenylacetate-CoA ligase